jgi:ribokinase
MGGVVVVGSINMDIVVFCQRSPEGGETVMGDRVGFFPGGKGANQAIAAARAGAQTRLLGSVGSDLFGRQLLDHLQGNGVDVSAVRTLADAVTGTALITVDTSGENRIVVVPGANLDVEAGDVLPAREGRLIALAQFETRPEAIVACFTRVRAQGGLTFLNPSPYRPVPEAVAKVTNGLIVNEHELASLAGSEVIPEPAPVIGLLRAQDFGYGTVVVTLGARGCVVSSGSGEPVHVPGFQVEAKDTTGAGDCFAGAFASRLALGLEPLAAARFANAAAAISVTREGAGGAAPTEEEVRSFLAGQQQ